MDARERIEQLAIINEHLVSLLPTGFESKEGLIAWLKDSPYSPYTTLYGGVGAVGFNDRESFVSSVDGKPRFNLHDETVFKFENFVNFDNRVLSANTSLKNIISSPALFKNYPDFRDIEVSLNISNASNGYMSGANYINENRIEVFASSNKDAMRVLLHELQHSIQLREGFTLGASYYGGDGVCDMAAALEERYLDKSGKIDYEAFKAEGLDRVPRYFTSYSKFQTLFKNKISRHEAVLSTPLGEVRIDMFGAFKHFKDNTHNEDRTRWSGGLISALENPLFIVQESYEGKMQKVFYKPMQEKNRDKVVNLTGFVLDDRGRLVNTTFFPVAEYKLEKYIKSREEDLLYFKYASSRPERVTPTVVADLGKTRTCGGILSEKDMDVKGIDKESREKNLKEWFGESKVVDANGEPLVVYHGTGADFSEFQTDSEGQFGKGAYFTNQDFLASNYAQGSIYCFGSDKSKIHPNVIPVYLSLKKPYFIEGVSNAPSVPKLKKQGYDGIIQKDIGNDNREYIEYVAFSPSQIKSIHNQGSFCSEKPDILEKNELGLNQIEKVFSIIPNGMDTKSVKEYLAFNGVSLDGVLSIGFEKRLDRERFDSMGFFDRKGLEPVMSSDYYNAGGEIEAREIERLYLNGDDDRALIVTKLAEGEPSDDEVKDTLVALVKQAEKMEKDAKLGLRVR
ncbi:MAG: hypothetical protein PHO62_07925 [Sulfurimonas sp.]|uniref:ADP-ribosyltransferase-containing protein n=1 Tax=Sulfurimonas sp. TaxID=2022749 RepID=UPI002636C380|nr:hypothetical protein [Sulfurimonas sp.]MDD5373335.1 hypothetical protein [Sulfurimonas sp.]